MMVHVISAANLRDADGIGKSDPYLICNFDDEDMALPEKQQTHVLEGELNPAWNTKLFFLLSDECKSFDVVVKDQDIGRDSKLGHCHVLRRDRNDRVHRHEDDYYLEDGSGATVRLAIQEIPLDHGVDHVMEERKANVEASIQGHGDPRVLLQVVIHRAEGLKSGMVDKSDPYAKIKFQTDGVMPEEARTHTIENNANPVWDSVFCFSVPHDLNTFEVEVMDQDVGGDDTLGNANLVLGRLGEKKSDRYALGKKGTVQLTYFKVPMSGLFE
jgi:Ca2+-dependent lipid-binding protein